MEGVARAVADLRAITKDEVEEIVHSLPTEWQVDTRTRQSLANLVCSRGAFVAESIAEWLGFLPLGRENDGGDSP